MTKNIFFFALAAIATPSACAHPQRGPTTTSATEASSHAANAPPSATAQSSTAGTKTDGFQPLPDLTAFVDPGAATFKDPVGAAVAILYTPEGKRIGSVRFVERGKEKEGLDAFAYAEGLPAGPHAFHVHVYGDCMSADGKSAGPHFNFVGSSFDKNVSMITGNIGELVADSEGRATHRTRMPQATLQGSFSILGRSVIVHARGNDPSKPPDGGAGDRIACGVIGIASALPPASPSPTAQR